jgi:hypothetical protein
MIRFEDCYECFVRGNLAQSHRRDRRDRRLRKIFILSLRTQRALRL